MTDDRWQMTDVAESYRALRIGHWEIVFLEGGA